MLPTDLAPPTCLHPSITFCTCQVPVGIMFPFHGLSPLPPKIIVLLVQAGS